MYTYCTLYIYMWVYTYTYLHTQTTLGTWPSPQILFLGAPNIGPLTYLGQVGRNPPGNPAGKRRSNRRLLFCSDIGRMGQQQKKRFGTLKETYTLKSWSSLDLIRTKQHVSLYKKSLRLQSSKMFLSLPYPPRKKHQVVPEGAAVRRNSDMCPPERGTWYSVLGGIGWFFTPKRMARTIPGI